MLLMAMITMLTIMRLTSKMLEMKKEEIATAAVVEIENI